MESYNCHSWLVMYFIFLMFYLFFKREHEQGRDRERETESTAGSRLWAVTTESDAGCRLMNHKIRTWAEVGRLTNWVTQAPQWLSFQEKEEAVLGKGHRETSGNVFLLELLGGYKGVCGNLLSCYVVCVCVCVCVCNFSIRILYLTI